MPDPARGVPPVPVVAPPAPVVAPPAPVVAPPVPVVAFPVAVVPVPVAATALPAAPPVPPAGAPPGSGSALPQPMLTTRASQADDALSAMLTTASYHPPHDRHSICCGDGHAQKA